MSAVWYLRVRRRTGQLEGRIEETVPKKDGPQRFRLRFRSIGRSAEMEGLRIVIVGQDGVNLGGIRQRRDWVDEQWDGLARLIVGGRSARKVPGVGKQRQQPNCRQLQHFRAVVGLRVHWQLHSLRGSRS
jgi:hypothetical protein